MKYSAHYEMNKPENSDQFNVEHFNENTTKLDNLIYTLDQSISPMNAHISDQNNPHHVTKSQVGLGNVDNTADLDKPVSTAMQTALNAKVDSNSLGTAALKNVPVSGDASNNEVVLGNDTRLSDSRPASDVSAWAKASIKPSYTASEVGAVASTDKGSANGVASLDANGKVPSSQLPSYVDDVIEGYYKKSDGKFYKESTYVTEITPEADKIYVDKTEEKTYRWSGSAYIEISSGVVLGETENTAYRGDRGKTAYDHSQTTSGNPHNVTASDVGLGNVGNFKAVSTVANQGLSSTEQANARANIGAGTSNFSGSFNDLTDTPTIPTKTSDLTNDSGYITSASIPTVNDATLTIQKNGTNVDTFTANASQDKTINITMTASDVGLGNVGNFKAVSTVANQGLSDSEKANARSNIGAGSSTFSGDYNDLSNKPTLGTASAKNVPSSGNASTTEVVMGNDSRLTDSRTPTSHTHTKSQITDFPTIPSVIDNLTSTSTTNALSAYQGKVLKTLADSMTKRFFSSWTYKIEITTSTGSGQLIWVMTPAGFITFCTSGSKINAPNTKHMTNIGKWTYSTSGLVCTLNCTDHTPVLVFASDNNISVTFTDTSTPQANALSNNWALASAVTNMQEQYYQTSEPSPSKTGAVWIG